MAYAFDLRQVCGGYAYFSTFTFGSISDDGRYEIRKPSPVEITLFSKALDELGQSFMHIDSEKTYRLWLYLQGWALVDLVFARSNMQQWLKQHQCIKSAFGSFTDIDIASPGTLKRSYRGRAKQEIHDRDGGRCLICGDQNALTLQHVWPYSSGGETSSRNLITLCEACNQNYGDTISPELYQLAGLHNGYEPSLIKSALDRKAALRRAEYLSHNLMHTRCDLW
ncbi:HNH endonuclease [Janthinobacterium sp. B9-8]|uniref:HNH endonuclease n=1 Tax=Janthinobacterium sp. B9-8 TaxID=1236179 RepID=UPI0009E6C9B2|nr:HNH endonuclease [Janthinobacterium sp. B9-8]